MNRKEELETMRNSLRESHLANGMAWTNQRKRMLERDLVVIRLVGGYRGGNVKDVQEQHLLPESVEPKRIEYTPSRGTSNARSVQTYNIAIPGTGCSLLPEVVGEDGMIHVASENGMNLGILVARARSPSMVGGHIVPQIGLSDQSMVCGVPLMYGPGANSLVINGEGTFNDVVPGRVHFGSQGHITQMTELLADKSKPYTGEPDMELVLNGAVLPGDRELEHRPQPLSRGIGFGETVDVDYRLESVDFRESQDPRDHYSLKFVLD